MIADVRIGGDPVRRVVSYAVSEEATPLDPSDTTGSVGGMTVTTEQMMSPSTAKRMRRKVLEVDDTLQGQIVGRVDTVGGTDGVTTVTGQNKLTLLAVNRTCKPFSGTLSEAVAYYLGLCGITDPMDYFIDEQIAEQPITLIGSYGNVWIQLKKLCAVANIEVAVANDRVVVRPVRTMIAHDSFDTTRAYAIDDSQMATSVEVFYYEPVAVTAGDDVSSQPDVLEGIYDPSDDQWVANALVYPPVGSGFRSAQVLSVAANEVKTVQIELGASVTSIRHPIPVDQVAPNIAPAISCYSVSGNDTLPIKAGEWQNRGGGITVKINPDTLTATLTIRGAAIPELSPFTIGVDDGQTQYNTLRLVGNGVAFQKKSIVVQTGVSTDLASQDVGASIDNEFIASRGDAYDAAVKAMGKLMGGYQTIQVSTAVLDPIDGAHNYITPPFPKFDAAFSDLATFGDFDTAALWRTGATDLGSFDVWSRTLTVGKFPNPAFGNVAGARVAFDGSWYRIRSATITPNGISYSAEMDMIFDDLATAHPGGLTMGQFDALYADDPTITLGDWNTRPVLDGVS